MKHSIRAVLALTFVFVGIYAWNQPSATPEQLQARKEAQLERQEVRYLDARYACMDERPYSAARADCLWEAQRDNQVGYLRVLEKALREAAAREKAQEAPAH